MSSSSGVAVGLLFCVASMAGPGVAVEHGVSLYAAEIVALHVVDRDAHAPKPLDTLSSPTRAIIRDNVTRRFWGYESTLAVIVVRPDGNLLARNSLDIELRSHGKGDPEDCADLKKIIRKHRKQMDGMIAVRSWPMHLQKDALVETLKQSDKAPMGLAGKEVSFDLGAHIYTAETRRFFTIEDGALMTKAISRSYIHDPKHGALFRKALIDYTGRARELAPLEDDPGDKQEEEGARPKPEKPTNPKDADKTARPTGPAPPVRQAPLSDTTTAP